MDSPAAHIQPLPEDRPHSQAVQPRAKRIRWYWLLVPLLAVAAYAPVLSTWFVGDDFGHLFFLTSLPWPKPFTTWQAGSMFYRPLSTSLSWELGRALFGTNALPYHIVSLALHALTALLLSLGVATISGSRRTGWIAGALFAVYPLSVEPVAWLAAQWDLWAAVCVAGAAWGFALGWKTRRWGPYLAGLACAALAVLMKESALPLPFALPFAAIATTLSTPTTEPPSERPEPRGWPRLLGRAVLWSAPYAVPTLVIVGLRLSGGGIGGYPTAATDWQHFFWDHMVAAFLQMIMPLNSSVFSRGATQVFGLVASGFLLVGLTVWGRRVWPMLLFCAAWTLVFLVPVLNLVSGDNPERAGERILYIGSMGLCAAVATLLSQFIAAPTTRQVRVALWSLVVVVLLAAVPVTWLQLEPWVQSSNQTRHIMAEMGRLVPHLKGRLINFQVANLPLQYEGSYVFLNGFDGAMFLFNDQPSGLNPVQRLDPSQLGEPLGNAAGTFNLGFAFEPKNRLYEVHQLAGVTEAVAPPTSSLRIWDFTKCTPERVADWQAENATFNCAPAESQTSPGAYAVLEPSSPDPKLLSQGLDIDLSSARWLRLAVNAQLPSKSGLRLGEWFWRADAAPSWTQEQSKSFALDSTGSWRTYWTYIPASDLGRTLNSLRLDPVNDLLPVNIRWIAVDVLD